MKKAIKVIIAIIVIIVLLALIFFVVDYNRVQKQERPIFCIQNPAGIIKDGGTIEYFGLGYKVIDFHTLAGYDDIKIGSWFMDYNDFKKEMKEYEMKFYTNNIIHFSKTIDETLIELDIPNTWNYIEMPKDDENDFYKYALKIYKDNEEQYAVLYVYNNKFGVCGTGRTSKNVTLSNGKEATIGYYDGNKNWSDISFYNINEYIAVMNYGLVDTDAEEIIEVIKTINITNVRNEYSFCGTITQVEENLFFVKPDEDEEIRKSADKIMVQKLKFDTNVKFEIGERVKITYDGFVMETYPAQINAIKYESIN